MSEISEPSSSPTVKPDTNILRRILIIMAVLLIVAVIASFFLGDWRVTAGLAIGGALSFVNFFWLKSSLGHMLGMAAAGAAEPKILWVLKYNLRFMSLVLAILAVYLTGTVSLTALFGGLLSLAAAIMVEGFIQIFLAVFKRGEV
jgi:hypothetical protein